MKLLRTILVGLLGILMIPGTIFCAIVFVFASVFIQLRYKLTKDDWSDVFEIVLDDYSTYGKAIYRFIMTGKFVIED